MPGDRVMTVGGVVDVAEAAAERDLGLGVKPQPAKDQNTVVLQRIQDGFTDRVVGGQVGGIQAGDFGADGVAELGDGEQTHGLSFLVGLVDR